MSGELPHTLIGITGAIRNDNKVALENHWDMIRPFEKRGFAVTVHNVIWRGEDKVLEDKIGELGDVIEAELEEGKEVSLLGYSAGGALALACFMEYPEISSVIAYSARLNKHTEEGVLPIEEVGRRTPLQIDAIDWIRTHESYLTSEMRKRIMIVRPEAGDDFVSPRAHAWEGAREVVLPFTAKDHYDAVDRAVRESYDEVTVFLRKNQRSLA